MPFKALALQRTIRRSRFGVRCATRAMRMPGRGVASPWSTGKVSAKRDQDQLKQMLDQMAEMAALLQCSREKPGAPVSIAGFRTGQLKREG